MEWWNHRAIGALTVVGTSAVIGLPLAALVVTLPIGINTSVTPDRIEPKVGADHRTWTHYLSTTVAMALLPTGVFAGALYALSQTRWAQEHVSAGVEAYLLRGLVIFGVLVAYGRLCGIVSHTVADAMNPSGSPLWGPWSKRDVHVLPKWALMRYDSTAARMVGVLASVMTMAILYLQIRGGVAIDLPQVHLPKVEVPKWS